MINEQAYDKLQVELKKIEKETGLYLADTNVDFENADRTLVRNSEEFFANLIACAEAAAGFRAEEAGQDINALIGRVIY